MKYYAHTHGQRLVKWFGNLPTFAGLSSNVRCFTIYQLRYKLDLIETRLPLFYNRCNTLKLYSDSFITCLGYNKSKSIFFRNKIMLKIK